MRLRLQCIYLVVLMSENIHVSITLKYILDLSTSWKQFFAVIYNDNYNVKLTSLTFFLFSLFIPLSTQNQAILMLARDQVADMESLHFLIFCRRKRRVIYQQGQKHIKSWEKIMVDICEKNDVLLQCILKSFRSLLLNYFSMVLLPNVFSNHGILFPD